MLELLGYWRYMVAFLSGGAFAALVMAWCLGKATEHERKISDGTKDFDDD